MESCWNESCCKHASGSYTTKHSDLNTGISRSYGRCEFSVLGNSNACGDITAADGSLEAIKGFSSRVGLLALHFAMGITHSSLRIHHSVSKRPTSFRWILPMIVSSKETTVLRQDVSSLLRKGAIEKSTPLSDSQVFTADILLCPKKDGGLRPILYLRHLNLAFKMSKFKMLKIYSFSDSTK